LNPAELGIRMPPLSPALTELWHLLFDLAEHLQGWCLIGGQMVALHGLECGRTDIRPTTDGDVLVDIRADPAALRRVVRFVTDRGFEMDPGPEGQGHRYKRQADVGAIVVDILAPDNLGPRATLTTTPPGRTIEVPGGTQALRHVAFVPVIVAGRTGSIPRPDLLAAILAKEAATHLPFKEVHLQDLAFLLSLVPNPASAELTNAERAKLRASELSNRGHPVWKTLSTVHANAGHAALGLLSRLPRSGVITDR